MEKILNALERKFGRYAVPDLIKYVVIIYCAGAVIGLVNPYFYYQYLSLNMNAVFHGQIWRLFTFLLEPSGFSSGSSMGGFLIGIIFFFFQVNLFMPLLFLLTLSRLNSAKMSSEASSWLMLSSR